MDRSKTYFSGDVRELKICKTIILSPVQISDAEYILSLRLNEKLNRFVSSVENSLTKQQQWIFEYKEREKKGIEYYFIIRDLSGNSLGTARVYGFKKDMFC